MTSLSIKWAFGPVFYAAPYALTPHLNHKLTEKSEIPLSNLLVVQNTLLSLQAAAPCC
jgi:hypothetical protein